MFILRNVCQRNNKKPSIDVEQTKQWRNNDMQNTTQKTKFEQHEPTESAQKARGIFRLQT